MAQNTYDDKCLEQHDLHPVMLFGTPITWGGPPSKHIGRCVRMGITFWSNMHGFKQIKVFTVHL
jgi:hypothetical protein